MTGPVRSEKTDVRSSPYDVSASKTTDAQLDSNDINTLPPLTADLPDVLKVSPLSTPISAQELDDILYSPTLCNPFPTLGGSESFNNYPGCSILPDIHGDDMTVQSLLMTAKVRQYTLPPYQRPYNGYKSTIETALRTWKSVRIIMLPGISCYVENGRYMILDGQHRVVFLVVELSALRAEAMKRGNLDLASEITQVLNPGGNACYIPFDQDKWFIVDKCIQPSIKIRDIYTPDSGARDTLVNSLQGVPKCRFSDALDVAKSDAAGMSNIELENFTHKILNAKFQRNMYENLNGMELLDIYRGMNAVVTEHDSWDIIKLEFVSRACGEYNITQLSNIWQFAESNLSPFENAFKSGSVNGVHLNGFQAVFHFCTKISGDRSGVGEEMEAFEKRLVDDALVTIEQFVRISRAAVTFFSGGTVNTTGIVDEGLVERLQKAVYCHISIASRDDYQIPAILLISRLTKQISDGAKAADSVETFEREMASLLEYRHLSVYTKAVMYCDATLRKIVSNIQKGYPVCKGNDISSDVAAMYAVCDDWLGTKPPIPTFRIAIHRAIISQDLADFKTSAWRGDCRFKRLYTRCNVNTSNENKDFRVDNIIIKV